MSTKPRNKQLPITIFFTPTSTNSRKNDGNMPMTRKRRRELEAEAGGSTNPGGPAEVETPIHTGKRTKRSSKVTPQPTPGGKGKARFHQRDTESDEEGNRAGPSNPPAHRAVKATRRTGNLLTPESEGTLGKEPSEDGAVSSLKTPLAALRLGTRRISTDLPPPQNIRRDPRSSNIGLPTPVPSSRRASKPKAKNPPKVLVRATPEPPEHDPIVLSSSPLTPLTDLPGGPSSAPRPQAPVQTSPPTFKVPTLPLHTPHRKHVENRLPKSSPPRQPMAVDFDEGLVPTSQSQDLRPFFVSPPRPGGSILKDTTPKSLRQSQGYIKQLVQPLPSVLATIQARGYIGIQESDVVPTSQIEETELQIPLSAQAGPSRTLAFSSPTDKRDNFALSDREPPSSERNGVLRTPTKITNLPRDGKVHITSPITGLLYSPKRSLPARRDGDGPQKSSLPPSSIPPSSGSLRSSHDDIALDFVQYQTTPTKRKSSIDSPTKEDIKLFESQATLSPTWSHTRSFEGWGFRDLGESQHGLGDGKAGLEAEAEGHEPGGGSETGGGESEESERAVMMASSMTEAESQDMIERLMKEHPELKLAGKAPQYKSSSSSLKSNKSGPDSAKNDANENGSGSRIDQVGIIVIDDTPPSSQNSKKSDPDPITNRIDNVGMVPPVEIPGSLAESESGSREAGDESQGGLGESALIFSEPTPTPVRGFLEIFMGANSVLQDSQSVIDISD